MTNSRATARTGRKSIRITTALAAAIAVLAVAAPAWAHVTVTGSGAAPGASDVELTFRVPNEIPSARTVAVAVQLPLATPIVGVLVAPTPGWSFTTRSVTLPRPVVTDDGDVTQAVAEIDWRATAGGIGAGEFGSFTLIAGQLPEAKTLTFKAIQTYSNGTKVSWIDVPAPGSTADPEHPAPVLTMTEPAPSALHRAPKSPSSSNAMAITALVVACLAGLLGGVALQRSWGRS